MQRAANTLVGIAVVVLAVWLVASGFRPPKAIGHEPSPTLLDGSDATDDGGGVLYAYGEGGAGADDDGGLLVGDLVERESRYDAGAGTTMPDGTPVPPLPLMVPHEVRFGVVLVSYAGAQPSAGAGRVALRSKADAKTLADSLRSSADKDFHAAVLRGDAGSGDDLGHVKLGLLEPAPEYVLFTLPVDGVGGPVDTPRGYWIVKRLE